MTKDLPFEQAKVLSMNHMKFAHQDLTAGPLPAQLKAEKLSRPSLPVKDNQVEEEEYEFFVHQWETYKDQANLSQNFKQHLKCCLGN